MRSLTSLLLVVLAGCASTVVECPGPTELAPTPDQDAWVGKLDIHFWGGGTLELPETQRAFWTLDALPAVTARDARRTSGDAPMATSGEFALPRPRGQGTLSLWMSDHDATDRESGATLLWHDVHFDENTDLPELVRFNIPFLGAAIRVTDTAKRPIRDARVQPVLDGGGPQPWLPFVPTDHEGQARLSNLPHGEWQVLVQSPGHAPVRTALPLTIGGDGSPLAVTLPRGAAVSAVIANERGYRIDGATVTFEYENPHSETVTKVAYLTRNGLLQAIVPRDRPFVLRVDAEGYAPWVRRQLDVESIDVRLAPLPPIGGNGTQR